MPSAVRIEQGWRARFGADEIDDLRRSLETLVHAPGGGRLPLFEGLEPPPGTWRSKVPQLDVLPDFPIPRQGGHPDGA